MTESDTRRLYVDPALHAKWDRERQIRTEYYFTDGQVIIQGGITKRGERCKADYVLWYESNLPLAVVEAKSDEHPVGEGMQQAIKYASMLDIPFAYSTNGRAFREHDMASGEEREFTAADFPSPEELWERYCANKGYSQEESEAVRTPYYYDPSQRKSPRYYQRVAVNRVVEAVAKGRKRALLVMATGTGKTFTAFQIIHRLREAGLVRHALFIADRNILVDQTMTQDFRPFGNDMTKVIGRHFDPAYGIHLALYQQFVGPNEEKYYTEFQRGFFDLVIIDECHRGSAKDDSVWREILDYFNNAVHVGMTATPRTEDDGDNLEHFGNPVYTYPLKQGIADGFLAPYKVIRVTLDVDECGWEPEAGQVDDYGQLIEDRRYTVADFNRNIHLKNRTRAVAQRITQWLKENGPMSKTIVFCVNTDHALRLREYLAEMNPGEMAKDPRWVMRITGNDKEGTEQLDNFIAVDEPYPVIATTSQMLTTGVDCKMCRLLVLDACINSMTVFKQIIGRGTRLLWNDEDESRNKRFFTVMDFRNATRLFSDKKNDPDDIEIIEETQCPACHQFPCICDRYEGEEPQEPGGEGGDLPPGMPDGIDAPIDGEPPDDLPDDTEDPLPLPPDGDDPDCDSDGAEAPDGSPEIPPLSDSQVKRMPVLDGPEVALLREMEEYYGANGELVKDTILTFRNGVLREYHSLAEFRERWNDAERKSEIYDELLRHGIIVEALREKIGRDDIDDFDLICHVAFDQKPLTRAERVAHAKKSDIFDKYSGQAKEVLYALLEKFAETGAKDLGDRNIFRNEPFSHFGSGARIAALFGGADKLDAAVAELSRAIYFNPAA